MSRVLLFVSDDERTSRPLHAALSETAPDLRVEVVGRREEIEALPAPTVILLDLMLSGDPAFDLLRWFRTEGRYRSVPVFVLGSEILDQDVTDAYALGADACLLKGQLAEGFGPMARGIATYARMMPGAGCTCS